MLAIDIVEAIKNKKIIPSQLSAHQRKVIVKYFMEEQSEISNVQIAKLLGITDVHVSRLKSQLLKSSAWEIEDIDIKTIAVSLKKKKEEYQRRAAKQENWALCWKIEIEYIEKMQNLGFIYKEPEQLEVRHSMSLEDFRKSKERYDRECGGEIALSLN